MSKVYQVTQYRLLTRYSTTIEAFATGSNSLKSNILPAAKLNFPAMHASYHDTQVFEHGRPSLLDGVTFQRVPDIRMVLRMVR
ncbi:hypothetical protein MUN82_06200 [Hymenobacter aerilatus]|uniref:Uncharacterized protein n=1 Tax=Hymenobacter aerilatus TaxID=2932251 RepID=A0A8T9T3K0_9BACT|nr:hypothetical protein [Hymenobacter aerilatus]UOR06686.1 hypothetical protein MUN82_06200 [Hymenobacter aerilatus]